MYHHISGGGGLRNFKKHKSDPFETLGCFVTHNKILTTRTHQKIGGWERRYEFLPCRIKKLNAYKVRDREATHNGNAEQLCLKNSCLENRHCFKIPNGNAKWLRGELVNIACRAELFCILKNDNRDSKTILETKQNYL